MKVLEQGKITEKKTKWTVQFRCPECNALYEVNDEDGLTGVRQDGFNGGVRFKCATENCNTELKITTPFVEKVPYHNAQPLLLPSTGSRSFCSTGDSRE